MKKKEVTPKSDGKIKCSLYGDTSGIECKCPQGEINKSCFIFETMCDLEINENILPEKRRNN